MPVQSISNHEVPFQTVHSHSLCVFCLSLITPPPPTHTHTHTLLRNLTRLVSWDSSPLCVSLFSMWCSRKGGCSVEDCWSYREREEREQIIQWKLTTLLDIVDSDITVQSVLTPSDSTREGHVLRDVRGILQQMSEFFSTSTFCRPIHSSKPRNTPQAAWETEQTTT